MLEDIRRSVARFHLAQDMGQWRASVKRLTILEIVD
jgi:hypothetical protein